MHTVKSQNINKWRPFPSLSPAYTHAHNIKSFRDIINLIQLVRWPYFRLPGDAEEFLRPARKGGNEKSQERENQVQIPHRKFTHGREKIL